MPQIVFKRGCGKGNNPPRSLRDRLERALIRLAVITPADASVTEARDAVIGELAGALAAADREAAAVPVPVSVPVSLPAVSVPQLFFTDARQIEPGYRPRPARSRREELEREIANLRRQLWDSPEDRRELEGMIEAREAELRSLGGNR